MRCGCRGIGGDAPCEADIVFGTRCASCRLHDCEGSGRGDEIVRLRHEAGELRTLAIETGGLDFQHEARRADAMAEALESLHPSRHGRS